MQFDQTAHLLEDLLRDMVREVGQRLLEKFIELKDETDHKSVAVSPRHTHTHTCNRHVVTDRFEAQASEIKRLQQHVAALKAENNQLQRRAVRAFDFTCDVVYDVIHFIYFEFYNNV